MLDGVAEGIDTARSRARIHTSLVLTGQIPGALLIDDTLRSAERRSSNVIRLTGASRYSIHQSTLRIRSTWVWHARICADGGGQLGQTSLARQEWVASESRWATAYRIVIDHLTLGVRSTSPWARVTTIDAHASPVQGTIGADDALRSTGRRRPDVALLTRADGVIVGHSTIAVWATGRWVAWILRWPAILRTTGLKWIPYVILNATAGWLMVVDVAQGVVAAGTLAGVLALVVDAGLRVGAVGVLHALRSAENGRVADVVWRTGARGCAVSDVAHGAWPTGARNARIGRKVIVEFYQKKIRCYFFVQFLI